MGMYVCMCVMMRSGKSHFSFALSLPPFPLSLSYHHHLHHQNDLKIERQWTIDGKHYSKTNAAWLANLDAKAKEGRMILNRIYGDQDETKAFVGWRLFFLTLVECFAMDDGTQWTVSLSIHQAGK